MRDVLETALGYAVLVGIVAAVVLGMRRGKANRAAAIASAHATGFAEGGKAAAAAHAQQSVNVAVDNSRHGEASADHQCADPYRCAVCGPVLLRVLRASVGLTALDDGTARHDLDDDRGHDYERPTALDVAREYGTARVDDTGDAPVPVERGRDHATDEDRGESPGRFGDHGRVRLAPQEWR